MKKNTLIFFVLFLSTSSFLFAQQITFKTRVSGSYAIDVAQTTDSGYLTMGNGWQYDEYYNWFWVAELITRLDKYGNFLWNIGQVPPVNVNSNPELYGFECLLKDSNIFYFEEDMSVPGALGILKINDGGGTLIERGIGCPWSGYGLDFKKLRDGNLILLTTGGVIKLNPSCDTLFTIVNPFDSISSISKTFIQSTYDSGFYFFNAVTDTAYSTQNLQCIKYNALGNLQWRKGYDIPYAGTINGIQNTRNNGFIFSFYTSTGVYVMKLDSAADSSNTYTLIQNGLYQTSLNIDSTSDGGYVFAGRNGITIFKTDSALNILWTQTYLNTDSNDFAYRVHETFDKGYVIAVSNDCCQNGAAVYLADSMGENTVGLEGYNFQSGDIKLYPNPATNKLYINSSGLTGNSTITIYNFLGQMLCQSAITNQQSEIDISFLPSGIYFLQMKTESGVVTKKFVKE